MKTGGWLSHPAGWLFAAAMLVVMAATGWVGVRLDLNGFAVNVLASLFSIALSLLIGYLLVDRFTDYVAERRWQKTRLHTLRAIAAHLCDMASLVYFHFATTSGLKIWDGRDCPNPETPSDFAALVAELKPLLSPSSDGKPSSDLAVEFYRNVRWDLDQIQMVLTPRVIQSSRNQALVDALVEFDDARRSLHTEIVAHELVVTHSVMPHVVRLMDVSGRLYGVVADEWRKCLPKGKAAGCHPHGS